jgi:hypothetical protein
MIESQEMIQEEMIDTETETEMINLVLGKEIIETDSEMIEINFQINS